MPLVGFIGPPCSGKTTTAARLFADLKDTGYPAEFVPEQARVVIAKLKRLNAGNPIVPNEGDQRDILMAQAGLERLVLESAPSSLVVADSSPINTLLYVSPATRSKEDFLGPARRAAGRYSLLFRCQPVRCETNDPNRIHSFEDSLRLEQDIDAVLDLVQVDRTKVVSLYGAPSYRASEAMQVVMDLLMATAR